MLFLGHSSLSYPTFTSFLFDIMDPSKPRDILWFRYILGCHSFIPYGRYIIISLCYNLDYHSDCIAYTRHRFTSYLVPYICSSSHPLITSLFILDLLWTSEIHDAQYIEWDGKLNWKDRHLFTNMMNCNFRYTNGNIEPECWWTKFSIDPDSDMCLKDLEPRTFLDELERNVVIDTLQSDSMH